ncbi:DUF484 domain-containing protein [Ahniella affigens]|uniref:DUF484 domain-containing protein n=1 Tax=Ahniella affigens TaxID=2021234 RepID=A0A2P1PXT7_9GAMM|nr:DUF484 family protein [Ahniella affigens]AVP99657.1 DUF484 domain-containing protein [Ahniella affigens]
MTDFATRRELDVLDVAGFLRRNPDFLSEFPDLALTLRLPRHQGASTSLASYQLDVLRDKNRALSRRLQELVGIAQDNEQLVARVHSFTLSLMRAHTPTDTLSTVVATLTEDFHTDLVRVVLYRDPGFQSEWLNVIDRQDPRLSMFSEFLSQAEPLCGRLNEDKLEFLFGALSERALSAALLPIEDLGFLAIGSKDQNRFHPGIGTLFLKLIADAVAAAMSRFGP